MRIDPQRMVPITEPKPREAGSRRDTGGHAAAGDVVSLSDAAAAASEPRPSGVTAKIARIRELLAEGKYPIDFDQLASRIVDDELARRSR